MGAGSGITFSSLSWWWPLDGGGSCLLTKVNALSNGPSLASGHLAESAGTSSQPLFRVTRSLENVAEGSWPTTGAIVLVCCRQGLPSPSGQGRGRDLGREVLPRPRAQAGRREGSADGVVRSQALRGPVSGSTSSDRPHQPSSPPGDLPEVRPRTARRWVLGARPCGAAPRLCVETFSPPLRMLSPRRLPGTRHPALPLVTCPPPLRPHSPPAPHSCHQSCQ